MCNTLSDLEKFIKSFEKVTQQYGLTMSVKKTCFMSTQHFKVDANGGILKDQGVAQPEIGVEIRNQQQCHISEKSEIMEMPADMRR